jgi:hypothetical protein
MSDLEMRAGALYRSPGREELRAVGRSMDRDAKDMIDNLSDQLDVYGDDIWALEGECSLVLATPEGLASCGYRLVEEPADVQ